MLLRHWPLVIAPALIFCGLISIDGGIWRAAGMRRQQGAQWRCWR